MKSNVKIPEKVNGYKVTNIAKEAFVNNLRIISVTIPDKVRIRAFIKSGPKKAYSSRTNAKSVKVR